MSQSGMSVTGSPAGGSGTLTSFTALAPLTGGTTTSGAVTTGLDDSGVIAGTYVNATITVDAKGLVTDAVSGVDVGALVTSQLNLKGSSAGTVKTATWTASQLTAWTALNGSAYVGASLSLSFNGATNGANGMDTGSFPVSGDLYIYAIYNPNTATWATLATVAGSGAPIYGGVTLPSGYTASSLIWAGKVYQSNLVKFVQLGNRIWWDAGTSTNPVTKPWSYLAQASAVSYTSRSFATVVPVNAKSVSLILADISLSVSYPFNTSFAITVDGLGAESPPFAITGSIPEVLEAYFNTAQVLFYQSSESSLNYRITGWTI